MDNGGAGLESPIFGLAGRSGTPEPSVSEVVTSGLRAPAAASGAPAAPSGASGAAAGRPVVGSNIREIPSKGRAGKRRGCHPSSCATESRLSGAPGRAEIDIESTFLVVSFADLRERWGDGRVGDNEEDEAGDDRDS
ncbi:MAG: hypothetical protein ACLP36_05690 [Acidimicrobiales bacterium]